MKIPFGTIDDKTMYRARKSVAALMEGDHLTEGILAAEFEKQFAAKFGWKHAIATSSGTTAGEVVWAAIRELKKLPRVGKQERGAARSSVLTPACAFVATASCLAAAGLEPNFVDISLDTLNLGIQAVSDELIYNYENLNIIDTCAGIQFVATMGKLSPLKAIAWEAEKRELRVVGDLCEAHGATLDGDMPNTYLDAAIYSLYPAHMVVGVEGGVICTDDDKITELCRSIKSHGRPAGSHYFDFQRVGFNAKWSDLHAAVGLASLELFDDRFEKRRWVRQRLIEELSRFEDDIILYRDGPDEIIAPHAFPVVLRDFKDMSPPWPVILRGQTASLHGLLETSGVECKTLFGSLPTQHGAFRDLGHDFGHFPVAEGVGRAGLHFGCGEFMEEEHVKFIGSIFDSFFSKPVSKSAY